MLSQQVLNFLGGPTVFWNVILCSLVVVCQPLRASFPVHHLYSCCRQQNDDDAHDDVDDEEETSVHFLSDCMALHPTRQQSL
jgi:hypothetical protein